MSKNITDLREAMFDTLEKLKAGEISVEQAKAASELGQTIINSAKVEVDYCKANDGVHLPFLQNAGELPQGVLGIRQHRLR